MDDFEVNGMKSRLEIGCHRDSGLSFIVPYAPLPWLIILCLFAAPLQASPENPTEGPSLEQVLTRTLTENAQIKETAQDIDIARAQLDRARAALFPKAEALILAAPIFEEKGNAISSTSNLSKWGPLLKGGTTIVQPLYSFGMISSYREAAENQITARTELTQVKRAEVLLTAKEFYYGFQMAYALENLVDDIVKYLEEAVKTAEDNKESRKGVKPHDLYRLKTTLDDLRQKKLMAKQGKETAERAVAWVSGGSFQPLPQVSIVPEAFEPKSLDEYLRMAKANRPEFKALVAGQLARQALRDAKRAQSYPILFVGGFGSFAWSPVREKQKSVFALDPFNRIEGGAGVGLKFDLEFTRHSAEASEEEAELMKLKATESYAAPGIELQVRKAFGEMEQAREGLEIAQKRRTMGKKWFVSSAMGWSIGITPAKELLEALEGDGQAKRNYIETVYAFNMALGRLSQAVGVEVTPLKYR